jgi:hypothetical protein
LVLCQGLDRFDHGFSRTGSIRVIRRSTTSMNSTRSPGSSPIVGEARGLY